MIIEFKSPRNTCGHREYLKIDTANKTYTDTPSFIPQGIEISRKELKEIKAAAIRDGYKQA